MADGTTGSVQYNVPSEKAVNDAVEAFKPNRKTYTKLPPNLAGNDELVRKVHEAVFQHFTKFDNQAARTDLMEYLKNADAKFRIAQSNANRFKSGSTQKQLTLSHVTSGQFHKSVRLITAGQKAITFSDPSELPVRREPFPCSDDYADAEGKRIADGENLWLQFNWYKEDWTTFFKRCLLFNNKNSMEVICMEWDRITEERPERVPGWYDENGEPVEYKMGEAVPPIIYDADGEKVVGQTFFGPAGQPMSYVFVEKVREKRNWNVLRRVELRNFWFDLQLDDIQKSTCTVERMQLPFSDLLANQKQGYYENVQRLNQSQLFTDESKNNNTDLADKYANAGQTMDEESNGLFDTNHALLLAPIKDGDDPKKAKWDEGEIPELYEVVFVGPLGELAPSEAKEGKRDGCVCVQLRKFPYHHKQFPYYVMHSHDDEKGMVRMGHYTLLECNIEEQTVTMDQLIDTKTMAIKAPFVGEKGNLLTTDLTFDPNKLIWVRAGTGKTALNKLEYPNYTQRTVEEIAMLKQDADEILGTLDAFKGEFAGSRTTGMEYLGAREQAMKPAIEDTKTIVDPLFRWVADICSKNVRQFADPKKKYAVQNNKGEFVGEVTPSLLYGDMNTRVVAIEKFEADVVTRQIIVNFIQAGGYDRAVPFMGKDGALYFWREVAKRLKLPEPNKIFPESKKYLEAENQAWADYKHMLEDPMDAMNNPEWLPKEGEQHDVHLGILEPLEAKLAIVLPTMNEAERPQNELTLAALRLYITIHKQLKTQEMAQSTMGMAAMQRAIGPGAQGASGEPSPMQATQTPGMEGEAAGDMMAGLGQQMSGG